MPYDENLADRIRDIVEHEPGLTEKKMFGGLGFLVNGNMAVAASSKGDLMVRVDPDRTEALLDDPHVARMEMGAKTMNGWLRVSLAAVETDAALGRWAETGLDYARSLPPK